MTPERDFHREIRNQQAVLQNLAEGGSRGQNAEIVMRSMRRLWAILMDTEFLSIDPAIREELKAGSGGRIGSGIAHDLRRASAMERYFRTRGKGFLPYIRFHNGVFVLIRRSENLDYIGTLHNHIEKIAQITLDSLQNTHSL